MADVLPFVFGLRDFDLRLMLLPHIEKQDQGTHKTRYKKKRT